MKNIFSLQLLMRTLPMLMLWVWLLSASTSVQAAFNNNITSVDGYTNCSVDESGDNYIFKVNVLFKDITAKKSMDPARAISVVYFTAEGMAKPIEGTTFSNISSATYNGTLMNMIRPNANRLGGVSLECGDCAPLRILTANTAELVITIDKPTLNGRGLAIWPGYLLRSLVNFYWDAAGAVYISPYNNACSVISPYFPNLPPEETTFSLRVPDWDLGEITPSVQQIALVKPEEQLCLDFPFVVAGNTTGYMLNAQSASMIGSEFQLVNNNRASKTIPYTLRLSDGKGVQFNFPGNRSAIDFPKDGSRQICYEPTFSIIGNKGRFAVGDYSDVINFEVITKP